jgi:two-component system chemotaxis sensor kinase CheA
MKKDPNSTNDSAGAGYHKLANRFTVPLIIYLSYAGVSVYLDNFTYFYMVCLCLCGVGAVYLDHRKLLRYTALSNGLTLLLILLRPSGAARTQMFINWILLLTGSLFIYLIAKFASDKSFSSVKDQDSFKTLMETTPDYVALVDKLNCVTYISKPLAAFAHIENIGLVIGRPILDLFREMGMKRMISEIIKSPEEFYENTWRLNLNGDDRYFKIASEKLPGAQGVLINMSDITPVMKARFEAEQAARALKIERDEIAAMKDNLNEGLFLMNRDSLIQPQYSRILEDILNRKDLQGESFLAVLSGSFKEKELVLVKDYFDMVFDRTYDKAMLDDINPLQELAYRSAGPEKILRCNFSPVDRGDGEFFLLANIQDITTEKKLQKQLAEEENKRQEEMRSVFEVLQIEPRVFGDFLEDAEYEFNRANDILKDTAVSSQDALVEIYQSIHAVKSNAVILGLGNFGDKLHEVETQIKTLRDKTDLDFGDMFHITVELERMVQEYDKLREIVAKIQSFKTGEFKKQDEHVLIETLSRAVNKASEDLNKKARLQVEEIDRDIMRDGPRRLMKEVLLQLVRNAVYHGIETPEERLALGKDETGIISLSIKNSGNAVHITLSDNGRGLDFDKIKQKAEEMGLFPPGERPDKNALLKILFAPGFSTAQTADAHAGRGIGLNLVRERIAGAKGSIKLQTEKGRGTAFHVLLPMKYLR